MKKIIFLSALLSSFLTFGARVPQSWLLNGDMDLKSNQENESELAREVEDIMDLQESSINELQEERAKNGLEKRSRNYELTEITAVLGISAGGGIGPLGLSGEAAAELHWGRNENEKISLRRSRKRRPHMVLSGRTTEIEIKKNVDPIVNALIKAGKIKEKKRSKVKAGLINAAETFQKTMTGVSLSTERAWKLAAIQANFGIEASGNVNFFSFGAALELTFEWSFSENESSDQINFVSNTVTEGPEESKKKRKIQDKLVKLMDNISDDLTLASHESAKIPSFKATAFEFGVAIGVGGEVGVASLGGSIGFTVVFERNEAVNEKAYFNSLMANKSLNDGEIAIAGVDRDEKGLREWRARRAAKREIKFKKTTRKKFRKGLSKSFKIGRFLAKRAEKREDKRRKKGKDIKWSVSGLTTVFELSLEGNVGVATVSGSPAVEIEFERQ